MTDRAYLRCSFNQCPGTVSIDYDSEDVKMIQSHDHHCPRDQLLLEVSRFKSALRNSVFQGYKNLKVAYDVTKLWYDLNQTFLSPKLYFI